MLSFSAITQAYPSSDAGASANGNFTLKIGGGAPTASVPDGGATLGLLAAAFAAFAGARRRLARR
jgi:hypothetical protein